MVKISATYQQSLLELNDEIGREFHSLMKAAAHQPHRRPSQARSAKTVAVLALKKKIAKKAKV